MLRIWARNDDEVRLKFVFKDAESFINDMNTNDDCMGDHEILLVELEGMVLYSSLGLKPKEYDDTLRTMDVYDWLK